MKQSRFYPRQEPTVEILHGMQGTLNDNLEERNLDVRSEGILYTPAVVSLQEGSSVSMPATPFPITINTGTTPNTVDLGFGIAHAAENERIAVLEDTTYDANNPATTDATGVPTPLSTGNQTIPVVANTDNILYVAHLETFLTGDFTADPDTGERRYTVTQDGYAITLQASTDPAPANAIQLATFPVDAAGVVGTVDLSARVFSAQKADNIEFTAPTAGGAAFTYAGEILTGQQHMDATGDAAPVVGNPHGTGIDNVPELRDELAKAFPEITRVQKESHTNAIVYDETASAVLISTKPGLTPTIDNINAVIQLADLSSGEILYLNGNRIDSAEIITSLNSNGAVSQLNVSFAAAAAGTHNILALTQTDLSGTVTYHVDRRAIASGYNEISEYLIGTVDFAAGILSNLVDGRTFGVTGARNLNVNLADEFVVDHKLRVTGTSTFEADVTADTNINAVGQIQQEGSQLLPPGALQMYAGAAAPSGYLLCDGAVHLNTAYPNLAAALAGTPFDLGGSFTAPDMRGRVPVGTGTGAGLTNRTLGASGGTEEHLHSAGPWTTSQPSLTEASDFQVAAGAAHVFHTHTVSGNTDNADSLQPFLSLNYIIKT